MYKQGDIIRGGSMHCTSLQIFFDNITHGHRNISGPDDLANFTPENIREDRDGAKKYSWKNLIRSRIGREPSNKDLYVLLVDKDGSMVVGYYYDNEFKGGTCELTPIKKG